MSQIKQLAILLLVVTPQCLFAAEKPNIILIMADDVGIEGLGCYGGTSYKTPHLDKMAATGMRFTQAYSQPLCTPTRVQLMTGKYNHRNWSYFGILDPKEKTFAHALKSAGYATGIFGKWQLQSYDPPELPGAEKRRGKGMHPKNAGFDEYALFHALNTEDKGSRYANPTMLEGRAGTDGELKTYDGRYGEDVWVEKILNFFDRNQDQPKFIYYPMALPHWPFQPTPDSDGWDPTREQETDLKYSKDMIEYMDTTVGNLMRGLRNRQQLADTIVIFYSDNGTHLKVTSQLSDGRSIPGGKATPRQTGIHVPLIAHWPDRIRPGVNHDLVDASDFFPTLLELAGATAPDDSKRDGVSFVSHLMNESGPRRDAVFVWYDPRPGWDKERFVRHVFALNKTHKYFRDGRLYRLTNKPLEEEPVFAPIESDDDRVAKKELSALIDRLMDGVEEPPLVDAHGNSEHDFSYLPKNRKESDEINSQLLRTGKEMVYGDANVPEHRLWIYHPLDIQPDEMRPCVFFIHGGSWGGKPDLLAAQSVYLQRRGWITVNIHFRAPKSGLTPVDTLRDVRRAYQWVLKNGRDHQIDIDRLVVSGGSAGGHLSLGLLTLPVGDEPMIEKAPRALVLFNPVIDLVDGWEGGQRKLKQAKINPKDFSPAHRVVPGLPNTLVMSGEKDGLITPKMLGEFQHRMVAAGNECEVVIYPDAGHGFFNYGRESNHFFQQTMWRMHTFLEGVMSRSK